MIDLSKEHLQVTSECYSEQLISFYYKFEHLQIASEYYNEQLLPLHYKLDCAKNETLCQCTCSFHIALDSWQDL